MKRLSAGLLAAAFLVTLGGGGPAYAYLDPGTGSMLLQGLLAVVVGAMVTGRIYWNRIKAFFSGTRAPDGADKQADDGAAEKPE